MRDIKDLNAQELRLTEALIPFGININDTAWNAAIRALQPPVVSSGKAWVYDKKGEGTVHSTHEANELMASGEYFDEPGGYEKAEEEKKRTEKEKPSEYWRTVKHTDFKLDDLIAHARGFGITVAEGSVTKAQILDAIQTHLFPPTPGADE